jgi:hypothetical protein
MRETSPVSVTVKTMPDPMDDDRGNLRERLPELAGGVRVIKVGAAAEEAVVADGGLTLLHHRDALDSEGRDG